MAKMMNDEQRLTVLEGYDPKQHLIEVAKDKGKPVFYYPAAWRLYELRLRHPHFTLEAEIVHMDPEKNMVIVQAVGYDGLDYATSNLKGKALKQGKLSDLDKVETKAKSRVARDVGIGTEYALDVVADETDATHDDASQTHQNGHQGASSQQSDNLQALIGRAKQRAWTLKLATDKPTWEALLQEATGEVLQEKDITVDLIARINSHLAKVERQRAAQPQAS